MKRRFLFLFLIGASLFAQTTPSVFYVVTAVDSIGRESAFSNEVNVLIPQGKSVLLTWNASTSTVSGYIVYRSLTTGTGYAKIGTTSATVLTFTDTAPNAPSGLAGSPK